MVDCLLRNNVIAWLRMVLITLSLYTNTTHMKTKEDGKNDDQGNW
jgi:hypothetical protein